MQRLITLIRLSALLVAAAFASAAQADYVGVSDASQISYAVTNDNRVYLRNLNTFNSGWHGCCGYYYFDLTKPAGVAQFSTFLTAWHQRGPLAIYIASASAGGEIAQVGQF